MRQSPSVFISVKFPCDAGAVGLRTILREPLFSAIFYYNSIFIQLFTNLYSNLFIGLFSFSNNLF